MNDEQLAELRQAFNPDQMKVLSSVLEGMQPKTELPIWERQQLQSPDLRVKGLNGNLPKLIYASGESQYNRLVFQGWTPAQSQTIETYEKLQGVSGDIVMGEVNRTKQSKAKRALLAYYGDFENLDDIPEEYHAELKKKREKQLVEAKRDGLIDGKSIILDSVKEAAEAAGVADVPIIAHFIKEEKTDGNTQNIRKKRSRKADEPSSQDA